MMEQEWLSCEDPTLMLEFLRGKASERKLRLFAFDCEMRLNRCHAGLWSSQSWSGPRVAVPAADARKKWSVRNAADGSGTYARATEERRGGHARRDRLPYGGSDCECGPRLNRSRDKQPSESSRRAQPRPWWASGRGRQGANRQSQKHPKRTPTWIQSGKGRCEMPGTSSLLEPLPMKCAGLGGAAGLQPTPGFPFKAPPARVRIPRSERLRTPCEGGPSPSELPGASTQQPRATS